MVVSSSEVLNSFLAEYNTMAKRGMELVLFMAAAQHVSQMAGGTQGHLARQQASPSLQWDVLLICQCFHSHCNQVRVLKTPLGNALLVTLPVFGENRSSALLKTICAMVKPRFVFSTKGIGHLSTTRGEHISPFYGNPYHIYRGERERERYIYIT